MARSSINDRPGPARTPGVSGPRTRRAVGCSRSAHLQRYITSIYRCNTIGALAPGERSRPAAAPHPGRHHPAAHHPGRRDGLALDL
jgi:hypothetical protein